jgi:hypothetical protein
MDKFVVYFEHKEKKYFLGREVSAEDYQHATDVASQELQEIGFDMSEFDLYIILPV